MLIYNIVLLNPLEINGQILPYKIKYGSISYTTLELAKEAINIYRINKDYAEWIYLGNDVWSIETLIGTFNIFTSCLKSS